MLFLHVGCIKLYLWRFVNHYHILSERLCILLHILLHRWQVLVLMNYHSYWHLHQHPYRCIYFHTCHQGLAHLLFELRYITAEPAHIQLFILKIVIQASYYAFDKTIEPIFWLEHILSTRVSLHFHISCHLSYKIALAPYVIHFRYELLCFGIPWIIILIHTTLNIHYFAIMKHIINAFKHINYIT